MPDRAEKDIAAALAVLRRAIHNEIAGQRFYLDASLACIDPWAKEIFASMAEDEENHARLLLVEFEALEVRGRWIDPAVAINSGVDVDITRIAFPEEASTEGLFPGHGDPSRIVDRRSDDLDALSFGIDMERRAIDLYGRALAAARDPAEQQAYDFLVEEETRHYHQLKDQWERLAGVSLEKAGTIWGHPRRHDS